MDNDTLICTSCDEIIRTTLGYEGYTARCSCSHFALKAGSGDKPVMWERLEDLRNASKFTIEHDWSDGKGNINSIVCTICKSDEATSVEIEESTLVPTDLKAVFECSNSHYQNDRTLSETAYYDGYDADKLRDYCTDDPDE